MLSFTVRSRIVFMGILSTLFVYFNFAGIASWAWLLSPHLVSAIFSLVSYIHYALVFVCVGLWI